MHFCCLRLPETRHSKTETMIHDLHERDARAYIVSLNFKRISLVDSNPRLS